MNVKSMVVSGLAVFASPLALQAAPLDVIVSGSCFVQCSSIGLTEGAPIGGRIRIDDAVYSPGGVSGNEALRSYDFSFGDFAFSSTTGSDPGFFVFWGAAPGSIDLVGISSFASGDPSAPGLGLDIYGYADQATYGVATLDGWRRVLPSGVIETNYGNPASLEIGPIEIAPVPLPAPAGLVAAGLASLAAFGWLGRRRGATAG
jgi:hypothetical protein